MWRKELKGIGLDILLSGHYTLKEECLGRNRKGGLRGKIYL
jgi:hypothetical protein